MSDKKTSKFLSYVLRHDPLSIGLTLDRGGWARVDDLLKALREHGQKISRKKLIEIVETNDKQRFALSAHGSKIRANQGHSITVELGYEIIEPPSTLFHGTDRDKLDDIKKEGLKKKTRHHVHLSADMETAIKVGGRRQSKPVILEVRAGEMHLDGFEFMVSENGVWLVDCVPWRYIDVKWGE